MRYKITVYFSFLSNLDLYLITIKLIFLLHTNSIKKRLVISGTQKLPFDPQKAFKIIRKTLQRQFFTKEYARLEDTTSYILESKIQNILALFTNERNQSLKEKAKKSQKLFFKSRGKYLQQLMKHESIKNKEDYSASVPANE